MQTASPVIRDCPYLVFERVLGPEAVRGLLEHAAHRQADFKPATIRDRLSGAIETDSYYRDCLSLKNIGPIRPALEKFVGGIAAQAIAQFGLRESVAPPKEFEITCYRSGGRFAPHIDTDERRDDVRVLSCVYYFAAEPPRFTGGQLRLYRLPVLSGAKAGASRLYTDIAPLTDTLVVFPSWLRHEVLPVEVPSGSWGDSRFTVNCWMHRASPH